MQISLAMLLFFFLFFSARVKAQFPNPTDLYAWYAFVRALYILGIQYGNRMWGAELAYNPPMQALTSARELAGGVLKREAFSTVVAARKSPILQNESSTLIPHAAVNNVIYSRICFCSRSGGGGPMQRTRRYWSGMRER